MTQTIGVYGEPRGGELDQFRVYLDQAGRHPLLSRQEEVELNHGRSVRAPSPRRVPRWLFGLVAPYVASFAVDTSMRLSNARARRELGWRPAYPTYREGVDAMVTAPAPAGQPAGGS